MDVLPQTNQCHGGTALGNFLEEGAAKLGSASTAVEVTGAGVTVAGVIMGPEGAPVAVGGVEMMVAGGAAGVVSNVLEIAGGIAQMVGGSESIGLNNAYHGAASLLAGAAIGWFGGSVMMSGNSVAARAFNSVIERATAFGGAAADLTSSISPEMAPTQAGCGP